MEPRIKKIEEIEEIINRKNEKNVQIMDIPEIIAFPFPELYKEIVLKYNTLNISSYCVLYNFNESWSTTEKYHKKYKIEINYWFIGKAVYDYWIMDKKGKIYYLNIHKQEIIELNIIPISPNVPTTVISATISIFFL